LLSQATLGATRAEIDRTLALGPEAWINEQLALPRSTSFVQWLRDQGLENETALTSRAFCDHNLWRKSIAAPDLLRQRVVHALAQVFVVSIEGADGDFPAFGVGNYLDILDANAFGSYRTLLEQVTLSTTMGRYLSMRGSRKADAAGRRPDENYAREILQLFSIGLTQLNPNGTPDTSSGATQPTYNEADVTGLARAFTGWEYGAPYSATAPQRHLVPMVNVATRHELGEKTFLGVTIPAGTNGVDSMRIALDTIAAHPNVGPFIGKQLIQRLVMSNPSPAYVGRVAAAFNNNGSGVRGDMAATVRAVLLDAEARDTSSARSSTAFGKLREPSLRFLQWARASNVKSASGAWRLGNLSDPATRLGQSPMHSPSVFNFYRPGYVPPNTPIAAQALVAPEFQITTETSVAGYLNFMTNAIQSNSSTATSGVQGSDVAPDYSNWLPLANDPPALVAEVNLVFAAGQLSPATLTTISTAVTAMAATTDALRLRRVHAAMLLTMAAPEYLVQQ
jgi:uncharacterized protein (DUF1800 family)